MKTYFNVGRMSVALDTTAEITTCASDGLIVHGPCVYSSGAKNVPGDNEADLVMASEIPLNPGDAAITIRRKDAQDPRYDWCKNRSVNAEAMAVVSVPWAKQESPVFRPPAIGRASNPIVAFFRNNPIHISRMDLSWLPRAVPWDDQLLNECERRMQGFSGDCYSGWGTDTRTPDLQHAGYGTYYASTVSLALVCMCMDIDAEHKRPLATMLVQRGIDLTGAFADGRDNQYVNGGHMWGRWPLMLFAGLTLHIDEIVNPSPEVQARLVERHGFYLGQPAWWCGWSGGWRRDYNETPFLHNHPSKWTGNNEGEQKWRLNGYFTQIVGAHVGTVLAFSLMNRQGNLGTALSTAVDRWMKPLPPDVRQTLTQNGCGGVAEAWGKDYTVGGYSQYCAGLWRQILG